MRLRSFLHLLCVKGFTLENSSSSPQGGQVECGDSDGCMVRARRNDADFGLGEREAY